MSFADIFYYSVKVMETVSSSLKIKKQNSDLVAEGSIVHNVKPVIKISLDGILLFANNFFSGFTEI